MNRILTTIICLISLTCVSAQYVDPWRAGFGVGVNNDGYEIGINLSYNIVPSFAVRMDIGAIGEFTEVEDWEIFDDDNQSWSRESDYASRFVFTPSVEMRSPALLKWRNDANGLRLFANPGISLSPGASGSVHPDWLYWQLRGGVQLNFSDFVLQMGYGYSNFDLYSGNPVSHNNKSEDRKKRTHTGFINLAFCF